MSSLPSTGTTSAWIVVSRGAYSSPSVLKYVPDHPLPALQPGQIRVRMKFASPYKGTTYYWRVIPTWVRTHWFPVAQEIADYEGAGIVEGVYVEEGKENKFKIGDEVFGIMDPVGRIPMGRGALALHATFLESELTSKPTTLSWEEASALNGRVQTAYHAIVEAGKLRAGQRLFINGGSTSVGLAGIQIAKAIGVYVVASCSLKSFGLVKQMGADEAVDYTTQPLHEQLTAQFSGAKNFDMIFDCVGSRPLFVHSISYLVPTGIFLAVGADFNSYSFSRFLLDVLLSRWLPIWLGGTPRKFTFLRTPLDSQRAERLVALVNQGLLHVPIDSVYSFKHVREAYARTMTGRATGKVIVRVGEDVQTDGCPESGYRSQT